jgi:hypothetical protein
VPEPVEPKQTLDEPLKGKGRPAHGKKRRDARRAPAQIRQTATELKVARPEKGDGRPASFGDAIAAMRRELSGKPRKKKKARASLLSMPTKTSRWLAKPRRSKP